MDESERNRIINRIRNLQDTRDYAATAYAAVLTKEIERLLDLIEPVQQQRQCRENDGENQ